MDTKDNKFARFLRAFSAVVSIVGAIFLIGLALVEVVILIKLL